MKHTSLAVLAAVLVATAAPAAADPRTQLEMQIGIPVEEAGRYSSVELALMKFYSDNPEMSDQEKRRAINRVRAGTVPRFQMSF